MEKIVVGIMAHVDSGKTTLIESILYSTGKIKSPGRVDNGDSFLDTQKQERERGITIFSKQARISLPDMDIILLDTPGHVDFQAEAERSIQVMDYCILVISATDGVTAHTKTIWKLLEKYNVPTIIFINKMDQEGADKSATVNEIKRKLSSDAVPFPSIMDIDSDTFKDDISMCSEPIMEKILAGESVGDLIEDIALEIANRKVFPVFSGSALKITGVSELLEGLNTWLLVPEYGDKFAARVYKIARDESGNRLTFMKLVGGSLKVRDFVGNGRFEEKVNQIRLYDGDKYEQINEIKSGDICAVTGLMETAVGQGLGDLSDNTESLLTPVINYSIVLPQDVDAAHFYKKIEYLSEEDPTLNMCWDSENRCIKVRVMGPIQTEILHARIQDEHGVRIGYDAGSIIYKETILGKAIGVGHYEPLKHYAEVCLLVEEADRGSGITIASALSTDELDLNWQRLIATHIEEKSHRGVLAGFLLDDVKITIIGGRAHIKHTEGGDFRQATYRAIRNALMHAQSVILEPMYGFEIELPTNCLGRAMTDIKQMQGDFNPPVTMGDNSIITGSCPVVTMQDYQAVLNAYTKGEGKMSLSILGYSDCHNKDEVINQINYDADADAENPASSVFCSHGAGIVIPWDKVGEYAHTDLDSLSQRYLRNDANVNSDVNTPEQMAYLQEKYKNDSKINSQIGGGNRERFISCEEIDAILSSGYRNRKKDVSFNRRYHVKNTASGQPKRVSADSSAKEYVYRGSAGNQKKYLLVDGYNIIFAWPELKSLANHNIDAARDTLIEKMCAYRSIIDSELILVFDAYKVKGNPGSFNIFNNIYLVYTKEAQTADQYIEKCAHELAAKASVRVATSDALEQMIIWQAGATRVSSTGFLAEVENALSQYRQTYGIEAL